MSRNRKPAPDPPGVWLQLRYGVLLIVDFYDDPNSTAPLVALCGPVSWDAPQVGRRTEVLVRLEAADVLLQADEDARSHLARMCKLCNSNDVHTVILRYNVAAGERALALALQMCEPEFERRPSATAREFFESIVPGENHSLYQYVLSAYGARSMSEQDHIEFAMHRVRR